MKKIYTARDAMEAHFLKGLIEAENIRIAIQGEYLAGGRGDLPFTMDTLPSLWVNEPDYPRALTLIAEYRERRKSPPPPNPAAAWTCPHCGESLEPQFTQCWKCNTPHP